MRRRASATVALVVALLLVLSAPALAQGQPQGRGGPIRLKAATFDPSRGQRPAIPPGLTRAAPQLGQKAYYIVQFAGPVEQAWKDQVAGLGAEILDYIPDYAFKVRMTPQAANRVSRLASVAYTDLFHPFYAVSPEVGQGQQMLRVRVERGGDTQAVADAAAQAGAAVSVLAPDLLLVAADGAQAERIAQALDTAWIEPYVLFEKHNEYGGAGIIGGGVANSRGYNGSTQIAAVADTGIGGGTAATAHRDIPESRVQAVYNWPGVPDSCFQTIYDDGAVDVDSGHGTHVAGSVLSGGDPGGFGRGVAPAAKLVFQATENYVAVSSLCRAFYGYTNDYYLTGLNDLYGLFNQAYGAGARIHANSWGSSQAGVYTANSATADQFVWDKKDMTITFSAGNSGADANNDGVVDNDSIGAPATAKNVITIGASENDRKGDYQCDLSLTYTSRDTSYQNGQTCGSMGGQNLLGTPRQRWGFTANPVADDLTAGNAGQMAAFSSRGPTDDGRIKPDVVAPGTWILSTYSSKYQEGYGTATSPRTGRFQSDGWGMPVNQYYKYFGGTSMSNPIAAGAATVVRDFYNKAYGVNASAALVKATLINSAVDLLDENNDGANDNDFPIPNNHEGWGRINLDAATDGTATYVDNTTGVGTGGTTTYTYPAPGNAPFKVSLVWSDYPSTETATKNLVNNLDLTVTSPTGAVYSGNVFANGWSQTGGNADAVNNVENVYVQSAAAGTWTVKVTGTNVAQGPQPYALVVRAGAGPTPTPSPTPVTPSPTGLAAPSNLAATANSATQVTLSWSYSGSGQSGFRVERCSGKNCTNFALLTTVSNASARGYVDTNVTGRTTYRYRVQAYNAAGSSGFSNIATVTTPR